MKTDLANLIKDSSGEIKKAASQLEKSRKVKVFYRCFFALLVGIRKAEQILRATLRAGPLLSCQ